MRLSLLAFVLLLSSGCGSDTPEVASGDPVPVATGEATPGDIQPGLMAPAFELTSTSGEAYSLGDLKGKTVVLEWLNYDCPYVGKQYGSGNMQALQNQYTAEGVVWLSIVSSAPGEQGHFTPEEMDARTAKENGAQSAVLIDASGEVGRLYGAKTTPHMFVISPEGRVVYNGAIDDKPTTDVADIDGATNFLVSAMEALAASREADPDRTEPYGCSVKYANV